MPKDRPILFLNPLTDSAFVALAEGWARMGVDGPEDLQRILRRRYPAAVVRAREIAGETDTVWYVYRDGKWSVGDQDRPGA